jgi:prepilin-type N-terminal cleavage/methylation domain-containing protein
MPTSRTCIPSGFTVLEVIVALTVGAMVMLGARLMLTAIADGADAIRAEAAELDDEANAERLLRALLRQVETAGEGAEFGGDRRRVRFTSWCTVPGGWPERCRAELTISEAAGESALLGTLSTGEILTLRRDFTDAELRYIGDAARRGTWFEVWGEGIALPVALGILVDRDTLILRIGAL